MKAGSALRRFNDKARGILEKLYRLAVVSRGRISLPGGTHSIRLIALGADASSSSLGEQGIYLSQAAVTGRLEAASARLGALPSRSASRFIRALAQRIVDRFARRYADAMGLEDRLVSAALYFHFWTQLCALVPLRHLARRVAAEAGGRPIFIELPSLSIAYLDLWARNELEPLFLYAEVVRRGGRAYLVHRTGRAQNETAPMLRLRLAPGTVWSIPATLPRPADCGLDSRKAIVTSGIRGFEQVMAELGKAHSIETVYSLQSFCETLARDIPPLPEVTIPFVLQRDVPAPGAHPCYEATLRTMDAFEHLHRAIRAFLPAVAQQAERLVAQKRIDELHCCDHYFLESAVMSSAVRKTGGRVVLWPHSANPAHLEGRESREIDEINAMTAAGARVWRARFPDKPVHLRPHLMLPRPQPLRPIEPELPLTIVVIGGAHVLSRCPLLDIPRHRGSYRRFFSGLRDLLPFAQVFFRPKPNYENEVWLKDILGTGEGYRIEPRHPLQIEHPNMVYVTISFSSTALLEGIGRGIPALIVRDVEVEDYIDLRHAGVPIGAADRILAELAKCVDGRYRTKLAEKQMQWYASEISVEAR